MQTQDKINGAIRLLDAAGFQTGFLNKDFAAFGVKDWRKKGSRGAMRVDTWLRNMSDAEMERLTQTLREKIQARNAARAAEAS